MMSGVVAIFEKLLGAEHPNTIPDRMAKQNPHRSTFTGP
jgi:hypothetical protein